jgi:hypothetical protein
MLEDVMAEKRRILEQERLHFPDDAAYVHCQPRYALLGLIIFGWAVMFFIFAN